MGTHSAIACHPAAVAGGFASPGRGIAGESFHVLSPGGAKALYVSGLLYQAKGEPEHAREFLEAALTNLNQMENGATRSRRSRHSLASGKIRTCLGWERVETWNPVYSRSCLYSTLGFSWARACFYSWQFVRVRPGSCQHCRQIKRLRNGL